MLKITKYSIPMVAAALVLTGRSQESGSTAPTQPASGAPASAQKSSAQSEQQQEQQKQVSEQQKNQQSIFKPGQISETELKKQVTEVNKASSFIGMAVKNTDNENIGKINDLVFDPEKGKISYAVISVGGILGVGDKLVALPITSLKPQPGQKYLVLNMQKSQLEAAPGLAQHNWPDLDAPGLGAAAGSETGQSSATSPSSSSSSSSSSTTPSSSSTPSATSPSSSTTPPSATSPDQSSSSSSKPQGSSPSSSSGASTSGSNSDSSQPKADSSSSDTSATQGESKKGDQ
jgi:sporulation protein YlmC with PRC-barrel domain